MIEKKVIAMVVGAAAVVSIGNVAYRKFVRKEPPPPLAPSGLAVNARPSLAEAETEPSTNRVKISAKKETTVALVRTERSIPSATVVERTKSLVSKAATTLATTAATQKAPLSKVEIVEYFNQVANKVKAEKPGFGWKKRVLIDEKSASCSNSFLSGAAPAVLSVFRGVSQSGQWVDQAGAAPGGDHSAFPVRGQDWASQLHPEDLLSASCVASNDEYLLRMALKGEDFAIPPANPSTLQTGKAFNCWTYDELMSEGKKAEPFVTITDFRVSYQGCHIECVVDANTNQIKKVTYSMPAVFSIDVKQFGGTKAAIAITREEQYIINN